MNLLGLTCDEVVGEVRRRYGRGPYHGEALYRAFYTFGRFDIGKLPEFAASPSLAEKVRADLSFRLPQRVRQETLEGVTKLVFRLADGLEIESVVVPMARHMTLCISSQVGCRMGCRFCQTGQMGLVRHLEADEIVAQVYAVKVLMGLDVRNVVFMGMGEPLDNFDPVVRAIRVLADQRGLDIAHRHITVSTAGLIRGIERLTALNWPRLRLAISLNAPNDALRDEIMPINRRFPMAQLKSALKRYPLARGNVLLAEYVLMKGKNDHPGYARQLSAYFEGLAVRLNLIPYNPGQNAPYRAPSPGDVARFQRALIEEGIFVRLRNPKGAAIRAACGQLGAVPDTSPVRF
jgi:23S rRNA (adenine2503-C2)-methyltransferase